MRRAVCQLSWVSCFIVFYVSFFHFSVLCTYYMCCISCQFSVSVIGKIRTRCTASCFQREIFKFCPSPAENSMRGLWSPPRARSYLNFRICVPRKYKVKTTSNAFALRTLLRSAFWYPQNRWADGLCNDTTSLVFRCGLPQEVAIDGRGRAPAVHIM